MDIHRAVRTKNMAELLKASDLEINQADNFGTRPLHYAVRDHNKEAFDFLLTRGALVSLTDENGDTVAHYAAEYGWYDMLVEILKKDSSVVNIIDKHGNEPLWTACFKARGNYELVKELLKNGANPNHKNNVSKSPIDMATIRGDHELLELLKKYS